MALQNATLAIRQRLAQKATQEDRLAALQEALGLPASVQRIECFDVSHTMGEAAVASCVIFDRLAMQSSNIAGSTSRRNMAAMTMRRCGKR
jgi:excinuclease ABC subunit C